METLGFHDCMLLSSGAPSALCVSRMQIAEQQDCEILMNARVQCVPSRAPGQSWLTRHTDWLSMALQSSDRQQMHASIMQEARQTDCQQQTQGHLPISRRRTAE